MATYYMSSPARGHRYTCDGLDTGWHAKKSLALAALAVLRAAADNAASSAAPAATAPDVPASAETEKDTP